MKKLISLMVCLIIGITSIMAQNTKEVSGKVISNEDDEPVINATVSVPGTTIGTVTDLEGKFSLSVPQSAKTIKVSFIGMETREVPVGTNLTVILSLDAEVIDEVVVTAYGTSTKGTFTGSATAIKKERLENMQVVSPTEALVGMSGVQVLNDNGQPGAEPTIRIRGVGSINASSNPLYIVDGVPYDGELSSINSADIESMTVLKDAASTALYGARGANGIVMITLKKGNSGKTKVNFDAKWGSNQRQLKSYDVMTDPAQYLETQYQCIYNGLTQDFGFPVDIVNEVANLALVGDDMGLYMIDPSFYGFGAYGTYYQVYTTPDGENLIGTDGRINPNATLGYLDPETGYYFKPDNWMDEIFRTGSRQSYDVSISGGNDRESHYVSVGYLNNEGIIPNSGYERINARLKADVNVSKWLKVGGSMSYANVTSNYPDEQDSDNSNSSANAFFGAYYASPVYPLYVRTGEDGKILVRDGKVVYDYGLPSDAGRTRSFMQMMNPAGDLAYNTEEYLKDVFGGQGFWEITPISGLSIRGTYGIDVDNTRYNCLGNPYMGNDAAYGGTATQAHYRTYGFTQQYLATYTHTWNEIHALDVTLGYEGYNYKYNTLRGYNTQLYNPDSYFLSNASGQAFANGSQTEYSTRAYFGRVNYAYKEKYIGNVSLRREASSRFAPGKRWGTFWSASAAWLMSEESFMQDVDWIDMLKLKASYGQSGNDNIGNYYAYADQYGISGTKGFWSDGTLVFKGNPDLTWETTNSWNAGFDFSFFDSRLNGTIEYWGRRSSDMLYYKPVAPSNGYNEFPMNVGSMTNSGIEIDLSYDILRNKNYSLNVHANTTYIRNKINKLHEDLGGKWISGSYIYEEGYSRYRMYLTKYAGVNPENGVAMYYALNDSDFETEDEYGNIIAPGQEYATSDYEKATATNRQATKNMLPKWYGGFGIGGTLYGFDLSVEFSYQLGGYVYDEAYQDLMHASDDYSCGYNFHKDVLNAWTPENTDTDVPRLDCFDYYTNANSDRWLTSSNYLSINNITLGYTLPKSLTQKVGVEKVRVMFSAENVALISARRGLDPRQSFSATTAATYSPIRTLSGGVSVTF